MSKTSVSGIAKSIKTDASLFPAEKESFLPDDYTFILFFSFPFYPKLKLYKKTYSLHGHLSLCLGKTVYQLHDPKKLKSRFLVSKMPLDTWLYEDGCWHDWDPVSPTYRHVHLYEKAEVKRTSVFYVALKGLPQSKLTFYENYFNTIERNFHNGSYRFHLHFNNCSHVINEVLYNEGWLKKRVLDSVPVIALQRLAAAWKRLGLDFTSGVIRNRREPGFHLHPLCLGMLSLAPEQALIRRLNGSSDKAQEKRCT